MEEELLKRNTDCVYFLASPFTCKKGAECEYRHNDMARLNPRDCWYWLSGNCLNPTCAFRHPPLETHPEASSEVAASSLNQSLESVAKTTVPCFFYFNGFCNKGVKCPFFHEPEETYSWKPKMTDSVADASVPRPETKSSGRIDTGPAPAKKQPGPSEMAITNENNLGIHQKGQVQKSTAKDTRELNSSAETFVSKHEEIGAIKRVSLQPEEELTKSDFEHSLGSQHSSEELVDGNIVRDEWWESSPGFDVLVDGKREDTAYEDDPEFLRSLEGNDEDHECLFVQQAYVDQNDYGERGFIEYDPYECGDGEGRANIDEYSPRRALDRKVGHALSHKRKLLSGEIPVGGCNNEDLRDYLRKRRMVVGSYLKTHALEHDFVRVRDERRGRLQMHPPTQRLSRRIASKVERNGIGFSRRTPAFNTLMRSNFRNSQRNGLRQHNGMKKRGPLSIERQQRSSSRRERSPQVCISFAGPKSLAEIKEKKGGRHQAENGSVDFDGPKPLSEILKHRKKTASLQNCCVNSC